MGVFYRPLTRLRAFTYGLLFGGIVVGLGLFSYSVFAATGTIQPNGNGNTNQGAQTPGTGCGAGAYDCLNDGVLITDPAPNTGTDYITYNRNQVGYFQLDNSITNAQTVTQVAINVYHKEGGTNMLTDVSLWDATEATQYGTTQNLTVRTASNWDTATFSGLSLTQSQLDGLRFRLQCTRPSGGAATNCIEYAAYAVVTYTPVVNVTVSATGNQQDVTVGATNQYFGGAFVITENTGSRNITSVKVTETGSVDAQNHLTNVRLYYETAASCASATYDATESLFGTASFNGSSQATFTNAGVAINTGTQLCLYVVADVSSSASFGQTAELEITNPSTDVVGSGSPNISPATVIAIPSTTTLRKQDLRQMHYHWRNDDGTETTATSATGGTEDTAFAAIPRSVIHRLRLTVSNEGNQTSASTAYRLEYAPKVSTCAVATGWTDVGAAGGDWDMGGSGSGLTEGSAVTNITEADGGVSNENTTFVGTAGQKETSSQTASLALTSSEYYEMEFAVRASSTASDGSTYCFRVTNAGTAIDHYDQYPEATIAADLLVSATSTQASSINIPTTGADNGGGFVITDSSAGAHTVSSFTLTASGTVDYQNDIDNIVLWYETDTVAPYDCTGESLNGDETQFGSTDTDGFSALGKSTFTTGSGPSVNPTQGLCFYVEYDVLSSATDGETIELRIADPSTDIVINTGSISPASLVDIPGVTTLSAPYLVQQHYHWRNNDDTESAASSATGGIPDTTLAEMAEATTYRLRYGVTNTGGVSATSQQFRLEWAQRVSTCAAASGWTDVDTAGDEFTMVASQLIDNADTTDIATSTGGFDNGGATFLTPNGGQKESSSQTNSVSVPANNIIELEYAVQATASTTEGATYCFRVTNAGTEINNYSQYAKATIKLGTDFAVYRNVTTILNGATTASITEGNQYDLQLNDATRAFIRITNVMHTGAGPGSTGNHNASDVTAYISNPGNITSGITFTRAGNSGDTRIAWEVVEYIGDAGGENEIKVRGTGVATYGASLTVNTPTISGIVDDNDVVPWITGQGNPNAGRFDYNTGLSTSAWNAGSDTATFTRGEDNGNAVNVSYAVLEFVGANWAIQRVEHTYTNAGSLESESITAVNSLSRAFIHDQKRVGSGLDSHADFGHQVFFSGIGSVQFRLDAGASTPSGHVSVGWIIENTQSSGKTMKVWRQTDTIPSSGTVPNVQFIDIGTTLSDITIASIVGSVRVDGTGRTFQEPIVSLRLLNSSSTQYEMWIGDPSDNLTYRTEVIEWPTAQSKIYQNNYRLYVDSDDLVVSDPWPDDIGVDIPENTEMTPAYGPILSGESIRIRMSLNVTSALLPAGADAFDLQYAERPGGDTCGTLPDTAWHELGDIGSTTALWRGHAGTPVDGTTLAATVLSGSDQFGTYEEQNSTAFVPNTTLVGEDIEYDWAIEDNGAKDKTDYCFRMVYSDGVTFTGYNNYPVIRTVGYGPESGDWIWYDDENNLTPTTTLAATNTAPIDIEFQNIIKLRTVMTEKNGASGTDVKFKLQYSESSDFSGNVFDVAASTTCTASSTWCYANGAGVDNVSIDEPVFMGITCSAGVGVGCGTHNEGTSTADATVDHTAFTSTEFEFTIAHAGARANAVYYFRLYDIVNDEAVAASSTYPSLVTLGPQLVFTMEGINPGTTIDGEVIDATSTPSTITFGSVPFDSEFTAAYRLTIDTDATEGYQVLMYTDQPMTNTYGGTIAGVTGTNLSPTGWATGCAAVATSCLGYHVEDDLLSGGSARFAPNDSYAALSTSPEEVMYSSVPTEDTHDIVYKLLVRDTQPAGDYEANISFISIPVF